MKRHIIKSILAITVTSMSLLGTVSTLSGCATEETSKQQNGYQSVKEKTNDEDGKSGEASEQASSAQDSTEQDSFVLNEPEIAPEPFFLSWDDAGLKDHVMDWQDDNLEAAMRKVTNIADGDIMLSDVWEIKKLTLSGNDIENVTALG